MGITQGDSQVLIITLKSTVSTMHVELLLNIDSKPIIIKQLTKPLTGNTDTKINNKELRKGEKMQKANEEFKKKTIIKKQIKLSFIHQLNK